MPTQNQIILNHLQTYGSITTMQAFGQYKITRLAARVDELRLRGEPIVTKMVTRGKKRFAEYSL